MNLFSGIRSFFAEGAPQRYVLDGCVDWHSHILPGVDDGVRTLAESLCILDEFERRGVREVWLTPHIMEDMPNTTSQLRERFAELCQAYAGNLQLHLASENMLDTVFSERLAAKDFLPIGKNADMLLVETSYYTPPAGLSEMLFSVRSAGLIPLLAHPERYRYMDREHYRQLHEQGVRFQLNLMSMAGHYGPEARSKAHWLASEGFYYCAGSDIHHNAHLNVLDTISKRKIPLDDTFVR